MKSYHRGYISVNLDAIAKNIRSIKKNIPTKTQVMLIVKADAYGHGATNIAKEFDDSNGIWGFGVASLEEAMMLRKDGIKKPILVLGMVYPDQYDELIREHISSTVFTIKSGLEIAQKAKSLGMQASVHIKIDTGMSRLGAKPNSATVEWIESLYQHECLKIEGVYTHFATADEYDTSFTEDQYDKFKGIVEELKSRGVQIPYCHCANSAASITYPDYSYDLVRVGISQYGLYPSEEVNKNNVRLYPALSWHSAVTNVHNIEAGDTVSYGRIFEAKGSMRIATIPIGYADGYPRSLSNKGYIIINGVKAKILGKVCMDQFMVDVTGIDGVDFMTPVTLIGKESDIEISVEELSEISDKFNYEFVCGIGKRMPRNYIKNGEIMDQIDYFA